MKDRSVYGKNTFHLYNLAYTVDIYVTLHFILLNLGLAYKINLTYSIHFNILELEMCSFPAKKTRHNVQIFNNVFSQSHIEGNIKQSHGNVCKIIKTKTGVR